MKFGLHRGPPTPGKVPPREWSPALVVSPPEPRNVLARGRSSTLILRFAELGKCCRASEVRPSSGGRLNPERVAAQVKFGHHKEPAGARNCVAARVEFCLHREPAGASKSVAARVKFGPRLEPAGARKGCAARVKFGLPRRPQEPGNMWPRKCSFALTGRPPEPGRVLPCE